LWAIGVVVGSLWAAWKLLFGWKFDSQNIGLAEAVAVELAVSYSTIGIPM